MPTLHVDGYSVFVDLEDLATVLQYSWRIDIDRKNGLPYALSRYSRPRVRMHRLVMGVGEGVEVDHVEPTCTLDNRRSNLRIASRSQNNANRRRFRNNTSGYRGVYPQKGRWVACLRVGGKLIRLGMFDHPEIAYAAYCEAKVKHFGDFARFE